MTRSVGKIDDICRKYSYKIYKSHGATYMVVGVMVKVAGIVGVVKVVGMCTWGLNKTGGCMNPSLSLAEI